jgi:hypothetical protein
VCPQASTLEVTLGEKEVYTNSAGEIQQHTPIYLNCTRDGQVVKKLREEMTMVIIAFYAAGLFVLMLITYTIINVYRRSNPAVFETPPPPPPPAG